MSHCRMVVEVLARFTKAQTVRILEYQVDPHNVFNFLNEIPFIPLFNQPRPRDDGFQKKQTFEQI